MKYGLYLLIVGLILSVCGCENVSPDAVKLSVDLSLEGMNLVFRQGLVDG